MPRIDFPSVPDAKNFSPLPEGKYLCQLIEIIEASTRYGDEMWKLHFKVIQGEYTGRIIFDNMVFSKSALGRVKLICSRLGLDTSSEIDVTTDLLQGRKCHINLEIKEYKNNKGYTKKRNVIPFSGYEQVEDIDVNEQLIKEDQEEVEENLPF